MALMINIQFPNPSNPRRSRREERKRDVTPKEKQQLKKQSKLRKMVKDLLKQTNQNSRIRSKKRSIRNKKMLCYNQTTKPLRQFLLL